ncbi:MAG: phospho-N-acetylmuramoyl-pentapeptide-transferase [Planctomycetes bacterium]|jgi:phospho-N-acetylmuramoyl-pentapeptide-transferase|nr:phospho-N-acetylmuramoyl-pentapeptide-transferase [Planctomycetota bacterium]
MLNFFIVRNLFFCVLAFIVAILWTPLLTYFLYKYKLGKSIRNGGDTPIYSQLHAHKAGTPTMGGILVWLTTLFLILLFSILSTIIPLDIFESFNFLSRQETLLPLGVLIISAIIGLFDDWLDIKGRGVSGGGGFKLKHRLLLYAVISLVASLWFYFKLDWTLFHIPLLGNFEVGVWAIPIFIFIIVATAFSVNETDGLDGLAGGNLLIAYGAFAIIAFVLGKYDLASFCSVIIGALLAFLWFNIPPARFYMGDTGSMSLGITLGVISIITNNALLLIPIGFVFLLESMSVIIQIISKKFRHKKVFLSTPIHHHFEAQGWSEAKIVMRFWVVGGIATSLGLLIFLFDRSIG